MRVTWIVAVGLVSGLLPATTAHTAPALAPGAVSAPVTSVVPSAASPWAAHARQLVLDERARAAPPPPPPPPPPPTAEAPAPPEHPSTWWRPSKLELPPLASSPAPAPGTSCEPWTRDPGPKVPIQVALQLWGPARGTDYLVQMMRFDGGWFTWGYLPLESCAGPFVPQLKHPEQTSMELIQNLKRVDLDPGVGVIVGLGPLAGGGPTTGPWSYYFLGANWDPASDPPAIPPLKSAQTGIVYTFTQEHVYASGASCRACSLSGLEIRGDDAPHFPGWPIGLVDFDYVHDLDHADLTGSHLTGQFADWGNDPPQPWRFDGATLTGATLDGTFTGSTSFAGAKLDGIQAPGATFQGSVNLSDAQLTNQANLKGATFADGVDLQRAHLNGATLTGATFNNVNLTGADLTGAHLEGVTFTNANLTDAVLTDADIDGATFTQSNLAGAKLNGAQLSGATFGQSNLTRADFTGATLTASQAYGPTRFMASTQLDGATLTNVDVSGVGFIQADLRGLTFDARWSTPPPVFESLIVGAAGSHCTTFPDQNLFGVQLGFSSADPLCETTPMFPGSLLRLEQIPTSLWSHVSVGGAYLYVDAANRNSLSGANLANTHLDGMVLIGVPANLTRTVFDNASLQQARFDLADFAGASLQNVSASQASFHGARFDGHDGLPPATFQGAHLARSNFVAADISQANFVGADLSGAAFNHVRARGTNFNGVTATNTVFNSAHIYGNGEAFDQATDLTGIDFSNAVLAASADDASGGLNFTNAMLTNARFDGAQCIFCNFTSARLNGASFSRAYLVGAILTNAVLQSVDFDDAWLYCGESDSACTPVQGQTDRWSWPLEFGPQEAYGPLEFATAVVTGVSFSSVDTCPDGNSPDETTGGCASLLPSPESAPQVPPSGCSASGLDMCPLRVSTLAGGEDEAKPVVATPAAPPAWATSLPDDGAVLYLTDDGALHSVLPPESPVVVEPAGTFHAPSGIAVGVDGSIWVADGGLTRIAPDHKTLDPIDIGANVRVNDVWVDPLGQAWMATSEGVIMRAADGSLHALPLASFPGVHITGDSLGNVWVTTHAPDNLVRIAPDGTVSAVVGTDQPGYNGNTDQYGMFLPGKDVQVNQPGGLAVGLDGIVYFADTANNLLRGYSPLTDHVVEVGGLIGNDGPVGGFNGDTCWSSQTEFDRPQDIAITLYGTFLVADSGNGRLRQFGYSPAGAYGGCH